MKASLAEQCTSAFDSQEVGLRSFEPDDHDHEDVAHDYVEKLSIFFLDIQRNSKRRMFAPVLVCSAPFVYGDDVYDDDDDDDNYDDDEDNDNYDDDVDDDNDNVCTCACMSRTLCPWWEGDERKLRRHQLRTFVKAK